MLSLADRARDFLDIRYAADSLGLSDDVALRRASAILGDLRRLDDAEREYARDEAGRFSSTGEAADHAREYADVAKAAAVGTNAGARTRARKADERASLAQVAHEHGDLVGATRHAQAAQRHAEEAVQHSGLSEWTARERASALRGVAAARTSAEKADAHLHAARTFGITEAAGRKHLAESQAHRLAASAGVAADARTAEERGEGQRVGVGLRVREAPHEETQAEVHTIQEPSRQVRIGVTGVESSDEPDKPSPPKEPERKAPVVVPVGPGDRRVEFGYTHARKASERPPPERRHFSDVDRSSIAADRAAKLVGLPPPPDKRERMLSRFFGRRDSVDYVRAWMADRYRADLRDVPDGEVLARARVVLRVGRQQSTGVLLVELARAIGSSDDEDEHRADAGDWDETAHPRNELGQFGEGGGHAERAYGHADAARAAAKGTTPAARASARKAEASAREAHLAAKSGDHAAAKRHAEAAERHSSAARQKATKSPPSPAPTPTPALTPAPKPSSPPVDAPSAGGHRLAEEVALGPTKASSGGTRQFDRAVQAGIRYHQNQLLKGYGMSTRATSGSDDVHVQDRTRMGGVNGFHNVDGSITLAGDVAANVAKFASQDPEEWGRRLMERWGAGEVHVFNTQGQAREIVAAIGGYKTLTHEAIHSMGTTRGGSYTGGGAVVEEIATELCARRVVRDAIGVDQTHPVLDAAKLGRIGGSYGKQIRDTTAALAKITSSGAGLAHRELERASLEFKRRSPSAVFATPESAVHAFVSHVDFSSVSRRTHTEEELGKMREDLTARILEMKK